MPEPLDPLLTLKNQLQEASENADKTKAALATARAELTKADEAFELAKIESKRLDRARNAILNEIETLQKQNKDVSAKQAELFQLSQPGINQTQANVLAETRFKSAEERVIKAEQENESALKLLGEARTALKTAQEEGPTLEERESQVTAAIFATQRADKARQAAEAATKALNEATAAEKKAGEELEKCQARFEKTEGAYNEANTAQDSSSNIDKITKLHNAKLELQSAREERDAALKKVKELEMSRQQLHGDFVLVGRKSADAAVEAEQAVELVMKSATPEIVQELLVSGVKLPGRQQATEKPAPIPETPKSEAPKPETPKPEAPKEEPTRAIELEKKAKPKEKAKEEEIQVTIEEPKKLSKKQAKAEDNERKKQDKIANENVYQDLKAVQIQEQAKRKKEFAAEDAPNSQTRKLRQEDMVKAGKAKERFLNVRPFSIGIPSFNAEVKNSKSGIIIKPKDVPVCVEDLIVMAKAAYKAGLKQTPPKAFNFNVNGFAHPAGKKAEIEAELKKMREEVDEQMQQKAKEQTTMEATKETQAREKEMGAVLTATSNPAAANPANDPNGKTPLTLAYTSPQKKPPSLAKLVTVNKPKEEETPKPTTTPTPTPTMR